MKRYYRIVRDSFGNPVSGASAMVYQSFTSQTVNATVYPATGIATPTTSTPLPIVTAADGIVQFAAPLGTYDVFITVPGGVNIYEYAWEAFDYKDAAFSGTLNSVGITMPAQFAVTNTPVTTAGTLTVAWNNQTANTIFAGPTTGAAAAPTFRALVAADGNTVFVDMSTNQAAIGGNKTFTGNVTVSGATTTVVNLVASNVITGIGVTITGTGVSFIMDIAAKYQLSSGAGWKSRQFHLTNALSTVTPTKVAVLGTIQGWSHSATVMNDLGCTMEVPFDWAQFTTVIPYVQWTTVGTNVGVVRHGLEYTIAMSANQEALVAATTIYVESTTSGVANQLMTSEFPAIATTHLEPGTMIHCRLLRDAAHANDTCTDASINFSLGLHYQTDRLSIKGHSPIPGWWA